MPNNSTDTYSARHLARRLYPPIPGELCERCRKLKVLHRHHKNGDIWDNRPENINLICGRCHNEIEPRRQHRNGRVPKIGGAKRSPVTRRKSNGR